MTPKTRDLLIDIGVGLAIALLVVIIVIFAPHTEPTFIYQGF